MQRPARIGAHLLVVLLLPMVSACSHLHPGSVDRTVEGRYDQVFRATVEMLQHRQFPLETVDRRAGRIVTGRRPLRVVRESRPVEKVNVRIKKVEEGQVQVSLLLVFVDQASNPQRPVSKDRDDDRVADLFSAALSRSFDAGAVYDLYLDDIEERLGD